MITMKTYGQKVVNNTSELYGLSSDEKPIELFGNTEIANGSTFYEMDTKTLYMYSKETATWLEQ